MPKVIGTIERANPSDNYPVVRDVDILGGYRVVASIIERDVIPISQRNLGMIVFVQEDSNWYVLVGGIENINWNNIELDAGGLITTHESTYDHTNIHTQQHSIDSTSDHNGVTGATENNFVSFDTNGLPKDSGSSASSFETAGIVGTHESTYVHSDISLNTSARHTHTNQIELDLVTDGDHDARIDNPHGVTKTQVGLSNVTNDSQLKRGNGDFNSFTEKIIPVENDIVLIEDSADTYAKKKKKWPKFGLTFETYNDATSHTTTSQTFIGFHSIYTTNVLPIGKYCIHYSFMWRSTGTAPAQLPEFQVDIDSVIYGSTILRQPSPYAEYGTSAWCLLSDTVFTNVTHEIQHFIDLLYRTRDSNYTAYVRDSYITIFRVA